MNVGALFFLVALAEAESYAVRAQLDFAAAHGIARPGLLMTLLGMVVTCPLAILLHEAGHLLAGLAAAEHCRRFVVAPLEVVHTTQGWRVRWIRKFGIGLVDLAPRTYARFRLRRGMTVAGGAVASACAAPLLVLAARAWSNAGYWLLSFCAFWCVFAALSIMPVRRGAYASDGAQLWTLIRGGAAADRIARELLTASSHAMRLRFREWPRDLIERLDDGRDRYGAYLAYLHWLDSGDRERAGAALARLLAGWSPADPPEYALEAAYFFRSAEWLVRESRDAEPWVRLRARAAVAGGEEGERLCDEARDLLLHAPSCGAHAYELDRVDRISNRILWK